MCMYVCVCVCVCICMCIDYIYIYLTAIKSNSNTVWFNFQTYIIGLIFRRIYIYIYIRLKIKPNTVWFNFQTYIIFSINLVSFKVTSGTDILYGCHLLLDVCIYIRLLKLLF